MCGVDSSSKVSVPGINYSTCISVSWSVRWARVLTASQTKAGTSLLLLSLGLYHMQAIARSDSGGRHNLSLRTRQRFDSKYYKHIAIYNNSVSKGWNRQYVTYIHSLPSRFFACHSTNETRIGLLVAFLYRTR